MKIKQYIDKKINEEVSKRLNENKYSFEKDIFEYINNELKLDGVVLLKNIINWAMESEDVRKELTGSYRPSDKTMSYRLANFLVNSGKYNIFGTHSGSNLKGAIIVNKNLDYENLNNVLK